MLPLEGLIVVSVEQAVAAPFCSSRLADAGAHVVKVERPEGDFARGYDAAAKGQSSYFVWLNRGKNSVVIDLATKEGRAALEELIASADVLLQNLKPGSMDKLGFSLERLRKDYPALICCTISGYGDDGPLCRPQGLRSPDPGRERPCLDHRRPRRPVARRHLRRRYRHRRHRACVDPRGADRAGPHRQGRRHPDLDVRRDGRLDGGAADQFGSRQSAEADGAGPSLDRALWRVQFKGRQGHFDLDPERARMEEALRRGAGSARPAQRSQICQHGRARAQPLSSPTRRWPTVLRR